MTYKGGDPVEGRMVRERSPTFKTGNSQKRLEGNRVEISRHFGGKQRRVLCAGHCLWDIRSDFSAHLPQVQFEDHG